MNRQKEYSAQCSHRKKLLLQPSIPKFSGTISPKHIILYAGLLLLFSACNNGDSNFRFNEAKPNIILILSDDAGYAGFGFYGGKEIPTHKVPENFTYDQQGDFAGSGANLFSRCRRTKIRK